jgi:outer membrane murein-binding lipoprotein Lpp
MISIFISHRHGDEISRVIAQQLEKELVAQRYKVFLDLKSIASGQKFKDEIMRHLLEADVMLIIIGNGWIESFKQRETTHKEDVLLLEVHFGLTRPRPMKIIPVLLGDLKIPDNVELPEKIASLFENQIARLPVKDGKLDRSVDDQIITPISKHVSEINQRQNEIQSRLSIDETFDSVLTTLKLAQNYNYIDLSSEFSEERLRRLESGLESLRKATKEFKTKSRNKGIRQTLENAVEKLEIQCKAIHEIAGPYSPVSLLKFISKDIEKAKTLLNPPKPGYRRLIVPALIVGILLAAGGILALQQQAFVSNIATLQSELTQVSSNPPTASINDETREAISEEALRNFKAEGTQTATLQALNNTRTVQAIVTSAVADEQSTALYIATTAEATIEALSEQIDLLNSAITGLNVGAAQAEETLQAAEAEIIRILSEQTAAQELNLTQVATNQTAIAQVKQYMTETAIIDSFSATLSAVPTITPTPTATHSPTPSYTPTPGITPSPTVISSVTVIPSETLANTNTPTDTPTSTPSLTATLNATQIAENLRDCVLTVDMRFDPSRATPANIPNALYADVAVYRYPPGMEPSNNVVPVVPASTLTGITTDRIPQDIDDYVVIGYALLPEPVLNDTLWWKVRRSDGQGGDMWVRSIDVRESMGCFTSNAGASIVPTLEPTPRPQDTNRAIRIVVSVAVRENRGDQDEDVLRVVEQGECFYLLDSDEPNPYVEGGNFWYQVFFTERGYTGEAWIVGGELNGTQTPVAPTNGYFIFVENCDALPMP